MSLSALPATPLEIMLGKYPRYYKVESSKESKIISSKEYFQSCTSIKATPVLCPDNATQDLPFQKQIHYKGTTESNGNTYESFSLKDHTPQSRRFFISRFKHSIIQDILQNGIPAWHLDRKIHYTFQKKNYVFDVEDLKVFNFCRFPFQQYQPEEFSTVYASHLAQQPLLLPCICDNDFHVFKAQHKAATELLQKYFDYHTTYMKELNQIVSFINQYTFNDQFTIEKFWETIYDSDGYYGIIERIYLS